MLDYFIGDHMGNTESNEDNLENLAIALKMQFSIFVQPISLCCKANNYFLKTKIWVNNQTVLSSFNSHSFSTGTCHVSDGQNALILLCFSQHWLLEMSMQQTRMILVC